MRAGAVARWLFAAGSDDTSDACTAGRDENATVEAAMRMRKAKRM
jgi:hypothetical protein